MPTSRLPTVEFDMVKEALIAFGIVLVLVLTAAAVLGGPYSPAITVRQVARSHPRMLVATAMRDLLGTSRIARRGPPYQSEGSYQHLGPLAPEKWFGVTRPVNPPKVDVLGPLRRAAELNPSVGAALTRWNGATTTEQEGWGKSFLSALRTADVTAGGRILLPARKVTLSGPLPVMMQAELDLARAGLLAAAINGPGGVYHYSVQDSLLFLQGEVLHKLAGQRNLLGSQWGILHEEGPYPGPWWVAPYSFLYQIPPYSTSSNGDLMAAGTMGLLFAFLLLVPVLPIARDVPRRVRVYRLIWRDYYRWIRGGDPRTRMRSETGARGGRSEGAAGHAP